LALIARATDSASRRLLVLLALGLLLSWGILAGVVATRAPTGWPATSALLLRFTCPLRALTGIACPACGATRAGAAILQGDLRAALALNPFIVLALGALLTGGTIAAIMPRLSERGLAVAGGFIRTRRGRALAALALAFAALWQTVQLAR
jgi:hypothetical protein